MPAITGLLIVAPSILQYLYADKSAKWLPSLPTLLIFLAGAFPIIVTTTYTNALYALGRPKVVLTFMAIYTVLTWGLGAPPIYKFGFVGIAIAGFVITYLTLPFVVRAMNQVVAVDTWGMLKKPVFASLGMTLVIYPLNQYLTRDLWTLAITILLAIVVYAGLIIALDGSKLKAEFGNWFAMIGKREL